MARVDNQAHNQLAERMAYLRTTLNDLKQAQSFGSSDVRTYYITTGTGDITFTGMTTTTPRCVEITLTPNTAASNPVIAYDIGYSLQSTAGSTNYYTYQPLPPVSGVQKFRVTFISGDVTKDLTVSFSFWAISPGTYTCVEVTP